jgi:Zn-dependent peptidase ImmA (M78 family)/transcriptional regulator with XRE-family HTH domain
VARVNAEILIWARETAGLDLETAARKIGLNAARGVAGADRLAALEAGDGEPSTAQLRRMAHQYHRPLLTFFMPRIPARAETGQDFRTLPDRSDPGNVLLETLLRDVKARQALVREAIEDDEDAGGVAMVGRGAGTRKAHDLAAIAKEVIGFDRQVFRASGTAEQAFAYLRARIEAAGVFVLLAGDCGHHSTAIEVSVFRGFAIADPLAPFIVINDQDAKAAWSFTLFHELAHLLIGEGGISGGTLQGGVEQLCNDTAATLLLDQAEIAAIDVDGGDAVLAARISALADRAKISRSMIAYQLFRTARIEQAQWESLRAGFRAAWLTQKDRDREKSRTKEGGPNWYVVRRHRLGAAILAVARQGMADGSLTPTRAAKMLGVKPMAVYPLLAEQKRAFA